MNISLTFAILALIFGFYMAWNIGANDVANAIGTSVGSKALRLKQAVILAAIFEFCGAFFFGGNVMQTLQKGIIPPSAFPADPNIFIIGMLSALFATGIWLQIASACGWPVSTTHAIVGAIIGFGLAAGKWLLIDWGHIAFIASSWIISPVLAGIIAYYTFGFVQRAVLFAARPSRAAKRIVPWFVALVVFILVLAIGSNSLKKFPSFSFYELAFICLFIGLIGGAVANYLIKHRFEDSLPKYELSTKRTPEHLISLNKSIKHLQRVSLTSSGPFQKKVRLALTQTRELSKEAQNELCLEKTTSQYSGVEKIFALLQILSASLIAFSHGANDVANAVGPLAAIFTSLKTPFAMGFGSENWHILGFGGVGIVVGLSMWGWRVIDTIGRKITVLTPTRGFCAEFAAAATILLASKLGLPVSTTHSLVGALLGVGFARGLSAINLKTVRDIVLSWVITIPCSALLSVGIFLGLRALFV